MKGQKGHGRLYRPIWKNKNGKKRTSKVYWLRYSIGGKQYRESSGTRDAETARTLLRKKMGDRETGKIIGQPNKLTFGDLLEGLERHYKREGNRSLKRAKQACKHLKKFFPEGSKVPAISKQRVGQYIDERLAAGAAAATVRYEIAMLNLAFSVAVDEDLLAVRPMFKQPKVDNARSGFFEDADFAALLIELPEYLQPLIRFLRLTGWRRSEALELVWDAVDWEGQEVRISGTETKSGKPKSFPFAQAEELKSLLEAMWKARNGAYVFQRDGEPIRVGMLRYGWTQACKRAGLADSLLHDLRRTAARDFRRAGVDESVIMSICGWETAEMFRRYNIINAADRAAAVAKRFSKKLATDEGTPSEPEDSLGSTGNI